VGAELYVVYGAGTDTKSFRDGQLIN